MPHHTAILDSWFAAFNAHDIGALSEIADPEIVIYPLAGALTAAPGAVFRGHAGMASLMGPGFVRFPDLRLTARVLADDGDKALAELEFRLADGIKPPRRRRGLAVYTFKEGRIARIETYESAAAGRAALDGDPQRVLTPREREVLALLAQGMTAEEIARQLVVSKLTIRTHVRNLKEKLGARTSGHAIAIAFGRAPDTDI